MKLRRVIVFAKEMDRMLDFYRHTLGLRLLPNDGTPGWAEFEAGGATLALHAIPAEIAKGITISSPPSVREGTPIKLVFIVSEVEVERARLVSRGVLMSEVRPWGACDGIDPEGNVFQIARE